MKKVYLLLLFVFGFSAFAQQKGISYQAVIINPNSVAAPGYNGTSTPLANKAICLSFKIVNSTNQVEYQESQAITTDGYGMVNVVIGTGTTGTGLVSTLEAVAWNQGNKKLVVGVNTDGVCSNYTEISNQVLNYTPYAYYALNSEIKDGSVTDPKVAMGINPAKVGLGNVNNTSDANKPVSTATQTALNLKANATDVTTSLSLKEDISNKSNASLGTSTTLYPTQNAVKTYVDSQISSATIVDADAITKGKIKLAGDLAGTADLPTVPGLALKADTSSLSTVATSGNYNDLTDKPSIPSAYALPTASASVLGGVKVGANLSIDTNGVLSAAASGNNASTLTGVVSIANGGTSTTSISGIKSILGLNTSKIAIGDQAGQTGQQNYTIALGAGAGASNQISGAIAIGGAAGGANQGSSSVAIGSNAGQANQSQRSVAVGFAAGQNNQGENAVAIGTFAGNNGQIANSIAINATGMSSPLNPTNAGFYVNPIRNASASNSLFYDPTTKEITYGSGSSGQSYVDLSTSQTIGGAKAFSSDINVFGIRIGRGNSGVSYNTVVGLAALNSNTTGNYNNAFGSQALAANVDGYFNSAFGQTALFKNTSGYDNSAYGFNALNGSTTGSNNSALGSNSAVNNTTGSSNTAIGMSALSQNTTGSNNTALGYQANVGTNNLTNSTAIGNGAIVSTSNTIQLGNANVTDVKTNGALTAASINAPIYASTPQALADGSTVVWNPLLGLNASVTLGGNRNLTFLSTPIVGSYGTLVVSQDGTGNRTLNLPSASNKVLGSTSTTTIALSTAAGAKDIVNFYYDGTNYFWNVGQGYGVASSSSSIANLTTGVTGTLAVANGGTGATTLTGLIKGSGTSALIAAVAGTDYLAPNGSAASLTNFPTFNQNTTGTSANVTGIVSVANGGTGSTNGSITGNSSISIAAGGSDQNVSILPSGAGSVGIGTNSPNSLAILDVSSTTKGFLPPRMTYAQKIAIASPPQGLMIYCTNCGTNGEPEYFNGVAWVNMAGGTAASVPITLGSTYGGGKVFYILQPGDPGYVAGETHGLIAATSDTQGYRVFACRGWSSGTSTALGTGAANTTTLLGCNETNFAAKLARAVTDGGYNDWSLPSKDELNKLYLNRNSVGNFIDVNYWSSSESNCCYAWYQKFSDGSQDQDDKNAQKGIRAIRSF